MSDHPWYRPRVRSCVPATGIRAVYIKSLAIGSMACAMARKNTTKNRRIASLTSAELVSPQLEEAKDLKNLSLYLTVFHGKTNQPLNCSLSLSLVNIPCRTTARVVWGTDSFQRRCHDCSTLSLSGMSSARDLPKAELGIQEKKLAAKQTEAKPGFFVGCFAFEWKGIFFD